MYESIFYERLIKLRMEKGVSARDMSLSLGQSAGYINSLENQNAFPSMQVFFYICEFLGVTPSEFFDTGRSFPPDIMELAQEIDALDNDAKTGLKLIIRAINR